MMHRSRFYNGLRLHLGLKRWFLPHPVVSAMLAMLAPRRLRLPTVTLGEFLGTPPPTISFRALYEPEINTPPTDFIPLCTLARGIDARRILEVGTYNGASAINFALACPEAKVTTYDIRPESGELLATAETEVRSQIDRRIANFATEDNRLAVEPPYDFIFIDGDHRLESVRRDSALALRCIRPGGIIAWHDYRHVGSEWLQGLNEVPEALNELAKHHPLRLLCGTTVAVLRIPTN
ncbi:MAG: class I SAM-dependent methyltransferase [Opitutae bacterium]|nr:class I SAM-dependent methyltransferase [Opitutae bacterium]